MANFTPDEMAAINEMARSGQMSDQEVRYFLSQMGAPMMPPTGAGAVSDMEMQAYQDAMPPGEMRPTGAGAVSDMEQLEKQKMRSGKGSISDMEVRVLMELLQRPGVADMLGALPGRGAITDQEMQGVK
jgi:hypothetical protein